MGFEFDDLPDWEFMIVEMSAGIYRVTAVRDEGIRGESSGSGPDGMPEDRNRGWGPRSPAAL